MEKTMTTTTPQGKKIGRPRGGRWRRVRHNIFQNGTLHHLNDFEKLTAIGLITIVDDEGIYKLDEHPYTDMSIVIFGTPTRAEELKKAVEELQKRGFLCLYEQETGETTLHIVTWFQHQYINKPSKSLYEPCQKPGCVALRPEKKTPKPRATKKTSSRGGKTRPGVRTANVIAALPKK